MEHPADEVNPDIAGALGDREVPEWHVRELEKRLADPQPKDVAWEEVLRLLKVSG